MTPAKQIRELKKQLKPISNVSAKIRCERLVDNMKIKGQIFNIEKAHTKQLINHQYLIEIKGLLHTHTVKGILKKVRSLNNKINKSTDQQTQKFQQDINKIVSKDLTRYQNGPASTNISATKKDCLKLGEVTLDYVYLKNKLKYPDKSLTVQDVLKHALAKLNHIIKITDSVSSNNLSQTNNDNQDSQNFTPNSNR